MNGIGKEPRSVSFSDGSALGYQVDLQPVVSGGITFILPCHYSRGFAASDTREENQTSNTTTGTFPASR
jgi:hypothetical protein